VIYGKSRDSPFGIATRLWAARSGI